mgnify:CR=1 FL=1
MPTPVKNPKLLLKIKEVRFWRGYPDGTPIRHLQTARSLKFPRPYKKHKISIKIRERKLFFNL